MELFCHLRDTGLHFSPGEPSQQKGARHVLKAGPVGIQGKIVEDHGYVAVLRLQSGNREAVH